MGDRIDLGDVQQLINEATVLRNDYPLWYQYFCYAKGVPWKFVRQYIRSVGAASSSKSSGIPAICSRENMQITLGLHPAATAGEADVWYHRVLADIDIEQTFDDFHEPCTSFF